MGLNDLITQGLAVADRLTADLQPNVNRYAYTGKNSAGQPVYSATPVPMPAIVEDVTSEVRTSQTETVVAKAKLTFLRPVTFDTRDKFVLPDGRAGNVVGLEGLDNRVGAVRYYTVVYLG